MEEVITPETLPDALDVGAADGGGADQPGSISLDALKEVLGKDFKDAESALKSVKDTYNYVGDVGKIKQVMQEAKQRLGTDDTGVLEALTKLTMEPSKETPAPAPQAQNEQYLTPAQLEARLEEAEFFAKNETLKEIKDVLTPLKGADVKWSDFVASDIAKKVIEPYVGYKEVQAQKSVMESNPRLGVATDRFTTARSAMEEARKAELSGDVSSSRQAQNAAKSSAIQGVIEAYDL